MSGISLHSWWCEQAATQTDGAQDEAAAREEMAHWQQQLSAVRTRDSPRFAEIRRDSPRLAETSSAQLDSPRLRGAG